MRDFLRIEAFENTVFDYVISLLILISAMIALTLFRSLVVTRFKEFAQKTTNDFDDLLVQLVESIRPIFLFFVSFYLSVRLLTIDDNYLKIINGFIKILVTWQAARMILALALYFTDKLFDKGDASQMTRQAVTNVVKGIVWGSAFAFLLDNLGFDISAIVAGLGIGGLAVALAVQSFLGDTFSAVSIMIDKPFRIGDFIIVGDYMGVVEHVGIKTTRIRSLFGEQLIFSNSDLTGSRIKNYKRMEQRRIAFEIGVIYETSLEKLRKIPNIIAEIVRSIDNVRFDRAHFKSYGNFSLNFEIVYYVLAGDYNLYMDIQQNINYQIFEAFANNNIVFAYPTQKIYLTQDAKVTCHG